MSAASVAIGAFRAVPEWRPPELESAALQGLAGRYVDGVAPSTEAAAPGILAAALVGFGSRVGNGPHVRVGATRHHVNENVVLVGPTGTDRKGDAVNVGLQPLRLTDELWAKRRILRGFGSGDAIIGALAPRRGDDEGASSPGLLKGRETQRR